MPCNKGASPVGTLWESRHGAMRDVAEEKRTVTYRDQSGKQMVLGKEDNFVRNEDDCEDDDGEDKGQGPEYHGRQVPASPLAVPCAKIPLPNLFFAQLRAATRNALQPRLDSRVPWWCRTRAWRR